ncbi:MAG: hypothetical protein J0G96_03600 [Flavobacteriia bacterium]|nr:hypothetical protein [Flavobacteriia bacterium]OJX39274.1 MAG: hypothetical protein BGO87_04630 [Flavobacteriia bacterium 40-80]
MSKKIIILIVALFALKANAQVIIGGNVAYQIPFGADKNFYGLQVLIEKPTNERNAFFGKVSFFFPQKLTVRDQYVADAIDMNVSPPSINLSSFTNYSTFGIEFGRKIYIINPIDYGFSLYGGSTVMLSFNNIKSRIESFDKTKYQIYGGNDIQTDGKGSIFNLGIGLGGGMKYDFRFGSVYMDLGIGYNILQLATNTIAQQGYSSFGSPLNFVVGVGYRKILFMK